LEADVKAKARTIADLKFLLESDQLHQAELQEEVKDFKKRVEEAEENTTKVQSDKQTKDAEIEKLELLIKTLQDADVRKDQEKNEEAAKSLREKQDEIDILERRLVETTENAENITLKWEKARLQCDELKEAEMEANEKFKKYKSDFDSVNKELEQKSIQILELQSEKELYSSRIQAIEKIESGKLASPKAKKEQTAAKKKEGKGDSKAKPKEKKSPKKRVEKKKTKKSGSATKDAPKEKDEEEEVELPSWCKSENSAMYEILRFWREDLKSKATKKELGKENKDYWFFTEKKIELSDRIMKKLKGKDLSEWKKLHDILTLALNRRKGIVSKDEPKKMKKKESKPISKDASKKQIKEDTEESASWLKSENSAMHEILRFWREELKGKISKQELGKENKAYWFFAEKNVELSDKIMKKLHGKELSEWKKLYNILTRAYKRREETGLTTDDEPVSDSKADTPSENAVLESIDDIELDATQLLARKLRRAIEDRDKNALLLEEKTEEISSLKAELKQQEEDGRSITEKLKSSERALQGLGNQMHLLLALTRMGEIEI